MSLGFLFVAEIESSALVPAPPADVFAFLSDLANHWRLMDGGVEVVELDAAARCGVVRLHGPLGMRRTVRTHVTAAEEPGLIVGTARVGARTAARVSWTLEPARGAGTHVRLVASVERATALDRLLLTLGGAAWLRRRFAFGLERLAQRFAAPARPGAASAAERAHATG